MAAERPHDDKGRFVSTKCNLCDCGELRHEGDGHWRCDGLLDPEDPDKELEPCHAYHDDGEPVQQFEPPRPRGGAPSQAQSEPLAVLERGAGGAFKVRANMDALRAIYAMPPGDHPLYAAAGVLAAPAPSPVALDTGLECSECGHDNYEAVYGRPFGVGVAPHQTFSQQTPTPEK